jgi:DNA-damage-inducible protein J
MPKNATINARVDDKLKARADKVLRELGVSTSDLITMLLHQIVLQKGIPFDVQIPNRETRDAMAELDAGKGEVFTGSGKELIDHLVGARKNRKA